jgi:alkylation response protein AidB-like acyl-CoA dehydrogenase
LLAPALQEDDAQLVTAEAVAVGGAYTVTGRKVQVAFPGRAAAFVVLAREDKSYALFLVEGSAAGVRHEGPDARLALACLETGTLILDGAPAVKLGGADLIARVLASARIAVSCLLAGIGRGAVTAAMKYAHERKQFDRFLHEFVAMQERLSRGDARVEAARALAHGAARLRDRGDACGLAAARARLVAGEAAMTAADDALQVFGGYGFSREYPAERFYRDARVQRIRGIPSSGALPQHHEGFGAMSTRPRLVVGISGSSGPHFGVRLLEVMKARGTHEVHLVVTPGAALTMRHEMPERSLASVHALADVVHDDRDLAAPIASGRSSTTG